MEVEQIAAAYANCWVGEACVQEDGRRRLMNWPIKPARKGVQISIGLVPKFIRTFSDGSVEGIAVACCSQRKALEQKHRYIRGNM